jgi:hypothetical protein
METSQVLFKDHSFGALIIGYCKALMLHAHDDFFFG